MSEPPFDPDATIDERRYAAATAGMVEPSTAPPGPPQNCTSCPRDTYQDQAGQRSCLRRAGAAPRT